jgi:hypothetical protein
VAPRKKQKRRAQSLPPHHVSRVRDPRAGSHLASQHQAHINVATWGLRGRRHLSPLPRAEISNLKVNFKLKCQCACRYAEEMSTATATRDLLATTALVFDTSDTIFEETQRLARSLQSRRAAAEAAEVRRVAAAGLDGGAASAANAGALAGALADCRAAAAAISSLHKDRDAVVEARREALEKSAAASADARKKLTEELAANAA